jgi:hypothetical protein
MFKLGLTRDQARVESIRNKDLFMRKRIMIIKAHQPAVLEQTTRKTFRHSVISL